MNTAPGGDPAPILPRDTMQLNTINNGKVLTRSYQHTLATAFIDRSHVGEQQADWLELPAGVGTGAYNDELRGWMGPADHNGGRRRFTPADTRKAARP